MIDRNTTPWLLVAAAMFGCSNAGSASDDSSGTTDATDSGSASATANTNEPSGGESSDGAETGTPEPDGKGPAEFPLGRRIRRMTADQYMRSLEIATGQTWPDYVDYAGALGKADYAEIVAEDRELSVTFDKFIHDAALSTCRAAVDADVESGGKTILRDATVAETDEATIRANLAYLSLRFLATDVATDDSRLDPWVDVVTTTDGESLDDEARRERWVAVCVGFATHPDFVAY